MSDNATKVNLSTSSLSCAVIFAFWLFWGQSGWYRVDCALGEANACGLIHAEYLAKAKP